MRVMYIETQPQGSALQNLVACIDEHTRCKGDLCPLLYLHTLAYELFGGCIIMCDKSITILHHLSLLAAGC